MKINACQKLKGHLSKVVHGPVGAEISLQVAPNVGLVSVITDISARELGLKEGAEVHAIVKASSVMIRTD
jgi:molybdopterin-binding protein